MNHPQETILICPLNWGLGHATRDIPIIKRLMAMGFRVVVASEAAIIRLLQQEIPNLETDYFPGATITYSSNNHLIYKLLKQLPDAIFWLFREKRITRQLVNKYRPAAIISDNRYGVRHPKVKSILITHQLMLKMPTGLSALEKPFRWLIKRLVSPFDYCWIPDLPQPFSLAGDLVHKYPLPQNAVLIGPLSRFMDVSNQPPFPDPTFHNPAALLVLLSGPEPQRSILEELLIKKLSEESIQTIMVTGKPGTPPPPVQNPLLQIHPHIESRQLQNLLGKTPSILCRSGYSTLMDLWYLNRAAILIPTPGQTEQEYLAHYHREKNHRFLSQDDLRTKSLTPFLKITETTMSHPLLTSENLLDKTLDAVFAS